MDPHAFLRSRRSIRRFQSVAVEPDVIVRLLTTATHAASAHNRQPWRFAVVTAGSARSCLADVMTFEFRRDLEADGVAPAEVHSRLERSRARIESAPVAIVLCMDAAEMDSYSDARRAEAERTMAIQSTANAGHGLLLAAHAEGLGAVWNCAPLFASRSVVAALQLPSSWEPQALILIGKPDEIPGERPRKSIEEISLRV
jgi:coenzyme F420-0:L-glutamate ligase/coenzyme F420-1:gamma-L-glutamate ligase